MMMMMMMIMKYDFETLPANIFSLQLFLNNIVTPITVDVYLVGVSSTVNPKYSVKHIHLD